MLYRLNSFLLLSSKILFFKMWSIILITRYLATDKDLT